MKLSIHYLKHSSSSFSKQESTAILANAKADAQLTKKILAVNEELSAKSQETIERANQVLGNRF